MNFQYITDPKGIEIKSMEIISEYLKPLNLSDAETRIFERIIHTAGDPDYRHHVVIHQGAIQSGMEAIRKGKNIYTDVEMARVGINARRLKEFGGEKYCLIADEEVAIMSKELGITRSMAAMRKFGKELDGQIIAIGNAPTALFEVLKLTQELNIRPALIIGVPVGFVGAKESKEALIEHSVVPYITVRGNKGGSTIAASICNALIYMS